MEFIRNRNLEDVQKKTEKKKKRYTEQIDMKKAKTKY